MMRLAAACLLVLVSNGCTRNAIFELELTLPVQPGDSPPLFAVVSARTDVGFDQRWGEEPLEGIPLPQSCPAVEALECGDRPLDSACSETISVVGDGEDLGELRMRVRFCIDPTCSAPEDANAPEHRVAVERAFYVGRYTQARVCIDDVPATSDPPAEQIERCEVRCRDGAAAEHCRLDGTHFCEPPGSA